MKAPALNPYSSSSAYGSGTAISSQDKMPRILFLSGWAVTLLYFPSGLLHAWLGSGVYARDALFLLHLSACLYWLFKNRELKPFAGGHWMLLVPLFFILPSVLDGGARVEGLTFVKWVLLWLDWIILGRLAASVEEFSLPVKILTAVTILLLLADLIAGAYERNTHTFVITGEQGAVTAFGVELDREFSLGDQLRVKGLQRDIFSFANLMGMGTVAGLWALLNGRTPVVRWLAAIWAGSFATMLLMSGGRSAFFGAFVCCAVALSVLVAPVWTRRHYAYIVLGWLVICLTISSIGVGRLTESIGGSMLSSSSVGNAQSAYMRDNNWAGILDAMGQVPVVLIFGSPVSALLEPKIETFYHWADNEYFWLLYHTGFLGLAAVVWYFRTAAVARTDESQAWILDAIILFLLFVMGEAIARESMTFIGVMPLFVAIGYYEAGRVGARDGNVKPPSERRRPRAAPSEASEFTRRIKSRAKQST